MCDSFHDVFCGVMQTVRNHWLRDRTVSNTHTLHFVLSPTFMLFLYLSISSLSFLPHLVSCLSDDLCEDGLTSACIFVCVCVCLFSQVVQARANLSSVSGWRRGSACVASPWVTCCVTSCSLTAIEGVTCETSWREESSCPRSVGHLCHLKQDYPRFYCIMSSCYGHHFSLF